MGVKLTKAQGVLLAKGCDLDKNIKSQKKELDAIKKKLEKLGSGTYTNSMGDVMLISETDKFTDIEPITLYEFLKKLRKSKEIFKCVKVQLTPLKKLLSVLGNDDALGKLRKKTGTSCRITFK